MSSRRCNYYQACKVAPKAQRACTSAAVVNVRMKDGDMYEFNDRIDVGATWIYSSGNCATLPMHGYHGLGVYHDVVNHIESHNNYRFNSYQRLDLVANFHKQKKHGERIFSINVYNTLCHNNPFIVFPREYDEYNGDGTTTKIKTLRQICIFPIIPTVSWQYKW